MTAGSREDGAKLWGWGWCGGALGDGVCVSRMPVPAPHPHLLPAGGEKGALIVGPGCLTACGLRSLGGAVAQLPSPRLRGEGPGRGMRGGRQCLWICVGLAVGAAAMPVPAPHPHLLPACGEKGALTVGPGRLTACGLWSFGGAVVQLPSPRLRGEGPGRGMRGGRQCLWCCVGLAVGAAAMPVPAPHPHLLPACGEKGALTVGPGRLTACGLWSLGGAVAQLPSPRLRGEGPGRGMRGVRQCLWFCADWAVGAAAMPVPAPHPHLLPACGEKGASTLRSAFRRGGHDWKIMTGRLRNGQAVASETVASMWSTSGSGRRRRPASMSR